MHGFILSCVAALSAACFAPARPAEPSRAAPPAADPAATIAELKAEIAALKAEASELRPAALAIAGVPLDDSALEDAAFAGLRLSDLAPETAAQLPIMAGSGLLVSDVVADGPAAGAGLKAMDVIAKVGDQVVVNADQFRVLVRSRKPGDAMAVTIYRAGKELTVNIPLGSRKQPKLGPGGRIAGAGFDTEGDVVLMQAMPGLMAPGMMPPGAKVMTMRGPNGEMTMTVDASANVGSAAGMVPPAVAAAISSTAGTPAPAAGVPSSARTTTRSVSKVVYTDEHVTIEWTTTDGTEGVVIKDLATDTVIFRGTAAPTAAQLATFGDEIRGSVEKFLEGRAAAQRKRGLTPSAAPLPPVTPARPKPGEASQPTDA